MTKTAKIFPLGENALTIDFGGAMSIETNRKVLRLADFIDENRFHGFCEIVPAYNSLTIFYDLAQVRKKYSEYKTSFAAVKNYAENALANCRQISAPASRLIKVPVCFDAEFAPDLEFVAAENNLTSGAVIEIFLARTYRVFMLGFLPGFAYMGEVDERIAAPRRANPRRKVPRGSVGIAGRQTGIYSLASPGGWQIIGRTALELFTPNAAPPTLFQAGDTIEFYAVEN